MTPTPLSRPLSRLLHAFTRWAPRTRVLRRLSAVALLAGLTLPAWAEVVEGQVRKVDAEAGKLTLQHGPIQSLNMPAMQMVYRVNKPEWLTQVQPGDVVEFSAEKVNGQYTVTNLRVKP